MAIAISFGDANYGLQAGIINGPVHAEFHPAPETPPNPSSTVPFRRDVDFVERGLILDQIHHKCATPGSWTALVGLGGVGKSQLAIEYTYRVRVRSPEIWVFWVHASNAARFEQSYRDIADSAKIPGRQNPKANIFKLLHDWLRDSQGRWILILDNLDDARFLVDAQVNGQSESDESWGASKPLRDYLPKSQNGVILITSRNREAALELVEQCDIIEVEPMDEVPSMALFKRKLENVEKKLGVEVDNKDLAELAAALEFMPLAIVQAAAYISERAPRCSVRQYLEQFRKSDRKRTTLLDHEGGWLRRDREAKNSIIIAWQISFNHIRQTRPSAADLLSLMSFFDRQGIPEALLKISTKQRDSQRYRKERDDGEWDDDDYSSQSSQGDEFEDDVVALDILPTLFPHAKLAITQQPKESYSLRDWASILYRTAWYAWEMGNGVEAEKMSFQAMKVRKKILGQEHEDTLSSMAMVGNQGRWDAAEELEVQVMETRKTKLGEDHPSTLTSMANLASTFWNQGRWDAAEELEVQVMETRKTKLGADHPSTLTSMANLASTLLNQGRWDAAEELFVQVMETSKTKLGADHPDTLASKANLASTYRNQGRWDAAEELDVQVMETRKTKLGADHPDTLISMANLASTLWSKGRWDAAEELFVQVMETNKLKLGVGHPSTLTSMANLASTYRNQGQWDAAEELEVQVMDTWKTKLGVDHPSTLTSMANLALTLWSQGRWDAAEELEVQVMETRKTKLGADHPDTLASMHNLSCTWKAIGRVTEAVRLMEECVQLQKRVLGVGHPHTLSSIKSLAKAKAKRNLLLSK
ncbi:TPR-like protein [Lindgomyces ingoldianus]|uniref:TPR-like protein n=1 Tax=Lindgomyces ingoldianus TaxID=673940 RepID=A0ACB6Q8V6_9PLEO|nr:TPR-like protein [Lindgomyces ingoldianus]KAF2463408.1 TPR-like protein [Lindgomyces ingoldianus]